MENNIETGIEPQDKEYGFEGGKVVLGVEHEYDINGKKVKVKPNVQVFEGKKSVAIRTKNGYDALAKILLSKSGRAHREKLADTLSIDDLEGFQ